MKKEWRAPEAEELRINMTENGDAISDDYDGDWVQINGQWYRPGSEVTAS